MTFARALSWACVSASLLVMGCGAGRSSLAFGLDEKLLEETSLGRPAEGNATRGDAVVRVFVGHGTCSGVLVSPRVVLTARHCVVETTRSGEATSQARVAGALHVELGGDYLPWGRVAVTSVHTCAAADSEERDLAALVLERSVPRDVPILAMATTSHIEDESAHYRVVGFGSLVWPRSAPDGREGRGGLSLEAKRRHVNRGAVKVVGRDTLTVFASALPGDSGGAVVDVDTHELVAVISRGDYAQRVAGVAFGDVTIGARIDRCSATVQEAIALTTSPIDSASAMHVANASANASGTRGSVSARESVSEEHSVPRRPPAR